MELEFSLQLFEKYWTTKFYENCPVGADLFQVNEQTDMRLIVAFRNFANAPKNKLFTSIVDKHLSETIIRLLTDHWNVPALMFYI
jgi:hypothetical protein